jgi:hypothetical protein
VGNAAIMVPLGVAMVTTGTASASKSVSRRVLIKFRDAYKEVTLDATPRCPASMPICEWELFVNKPGIPAQTPIGADPDEQPSSLHVTWWR